MAELDIVIPVYNEGGRIVSLIDDLRASVAVPFRVLICYDFDDDDTLPAIAGYPADRADILAVKNSEGGPHAAVRAGLEATTAPMVLVYMADDSFNAGLIDAMVAMLRDGYDFVVASRFMPGGTHEGCRWYKVLPTRVASFTLHHFARVPVRDSTNSFQLFSRRVIDSIEIESRTGFTFSIELLVKTLRLGWMAGELPALWEEREDRPSRFKIIEWMPAYMRWYVYAYATAWLGRGPETVARKPAAS